MTRSATDLKASELTIACANYHLRRVPIPSAISEIYSDQEILRQLNAISYLPKQYDRTAKAKSKKGLSTLQQQLVNFFEEEVLLTGARPTLRQAAAAINRGLSQTCMLAVACGLKGYPIDFLAAKDCRQKTSRKLEKRLLPVQQHRLLSFAESFVRVVHRQPTRKEAAEHLGLSGNALNGLYQRLKKNGYPIKFNEQAPKVAANRAINSNAQKRGKIDEVLVMNY